MIARAAQVQLCLSAGTTLCVLLRAPSVWAGPGAERGLPAVGAQQARLPRRRLPLTAHAPAREWLARICQCSR